MKFLANHNTIIFGQTGSGKTTFILRVIREKLVHPFPSKVYYMYGVWQSFMNNYPDITFIEGLDFDRVDTSVPTMVVVDDLILDDNKDVATAFIRGSHHKRMSIFYITQNLFPNCSTYRIMSNNAHFFILFHNQRNFRQIHTLARQIFIGRDLQRIFEAYKRASQVARGFIILSFSPLLPKELTVTTDFFAPCLSVYL